jgi:glycosyltransferase involved in cell wall biosynthesis
MENKAIKILFITPFLGGGGAEKNIVNVVNLLDQEKFEIHVLVCGSNARYRSFLSNNISIKILGKTNVRSSLFEVFKTLWSLNPDIVFTSTNQLGVPLQLFNFFFWTKFINVIRLPSLPSNGLGRTFRDKVLQLFEGFAYRNANKIIAQSTEMKLEIEDFYGVPSSKIQVIRNPVLRSQLISLGQGDPVYNSDDYNVVAVGTLYSVKGFDLLIQAIGKLVPEIPHIKLHILGQEGIEAGYRKYLLELVKELGLEQIVVFHGYKDNPFPFIKSAQLFVLSSRQEGFPNVVLEALTLGTPVVATNCVNFDTIIREGENGIVVEKESIDELVRGILFARGIESFEYKHTNFDYNKWFESLIA